MSRLRNQHHSGSPIALSGEAEPIVQHALEAFGSEEKAWHWFKRKTPPVCISEAIKGWVDFGIVTKKKDPHADLTGSSTGTVDANVKHILTKANFF